jgi:hypothetical protein
MRSQQLFGAIGPTRDEAHPFQSNGQVSTVRSEGPVRVVRLWRQPSNRKRNADKEDGLVMRPELARATAIEVLIGSSL